MKSRILLVGALSEMMLGVIGSAIVKYSTDKAEWKIQTHQQIPSNQGPRDKYGRVR